MHSIDIDRTKPCIEGLDLVESAIVFVDQEKTNGTMEKVTTETTRTRDDEDHLPLSEQTNRPEDIPIHTQTINAWHPILDPNWVIFTYLALAAIMIPFGMFCCVGIW